MDEFRRVPPRLTVTPTASVFTVASALRGPGQAVAAELVAAARAALEPADLAALAPLGSPPMPDLVAFIDDDAPPDLPAAVQWIATLPERQLLAQIEATRPRAAIWEHVARHPRRWLLAYARALGRVWTAIRPHWAAASGLIEREAERLETAIRHGALPEIMAGIHHLAAVSDGAWRLHDDEVAKLSEALGPGPLRIPDEGLAITPTLAGPGSACLVLPEPGVLSSILYPLPGAMRVINGDVLPPAMALEALLGSQRAAILRLLDHPHHAGAVARALQLTPGAVTHHLKALEASGLVLRERDARHVVVRRSHRGSALLGLYDDH